VTGSGDFDPATANIGLSTVYYDYTNSLGCSNRDSIKIRVFDLPDASIKSAGPFCENISAQQLSALINTGGKFIEQTYLDSNGLFHPSIAKVGAHKVKYKYTDANLCSNIDSITISVLKKPDAQILPLGPYCQNASAAKINVAENGGTFKSEAYISLNGDFMPDKANIGSNRIIYSIVNSNNCAEADTVFVTVNKAPNNTITLQPENGCSPLKVIFSTEIEDKIEWEINSVKYSNPKDSLILLSGLYEVKLKVENSFSCVQNLKDTITVYQPPVADFDFSPDKLYMSDPSAQFIDRSKGNIVKWNWNFGDNDSSALTDPIHNYKQPGSYKIVLFVKDNNNCTDSSSGLLNVLDLFVYHIPSVFSPNDDGHNDVFAIEGLGIVWINCQIFNRWGEKLLDVKNFTSWDGMYQGEMVQDGVYLYLVQIKDNKGRIHYIKGEVTVLR
jgi:gliding motility-associated-like protein